jgi:cell filamentation protein
MQYLAAARNSGGASFGRRSRARRRATRAGASGRYSALLTEGQYEPGSRGKVLRNLIGVVSARGMARLERDALERMTVRSLRALKSDLRFTAGQIRELHREWLGGIYPWAGEYRLVNLSKGGFMFAASSRIPVLMQQLEDGLLRRHTPCHVENRRELASVVAEVHAEIVLIHPFREGNGRIARHVANMMVWQVGLQPLDFRPIATAGKQRYFAAIRAAQAGNYLPLAGIFESLIASA